MVHGTSRFEKVSHGKIEILYTMTSFFSDLCFEFCRYNSSDTVICFYISFSLQIVKLREMFPHGNGFVLVFDYMLSDLSEVIRSSMKPLTEAQVKSYMLMLLKGVEFMHGNNIMHRVCLCLQTHRICYDNLGFFVDNKTYIF